MPDADYKTVLEGTTAQGDKQLNVFYNHSNDTQNNVLTTLGNWAGDLVTLLQPIMVTGSGLEKVVHFVHGLAGWLEIGSDILNTQGTATGDALPPQNAAVVNALTGYFKVHPKKFFGGLPSSIVQADGTLDSAALVDLAAIAAFWTSPYSSGPSYLVPGTWSKHYNVFISTDGGYVDARVGSQRRRKQGVGA
jgi:hypothetical protein